ncbi:MULTISPECIES: hypothetical protein [unclassified Rhizobium]
MLNDVSFNFLAVSLASPWVGVTRWFPRPAPLSHRRYIKIVMRSAQHQSVGSLHLDAGIVALAKYAIAIARQRVPDIGAASICRQMGLDTFAERF